MFNGAFTILEIVIMEKLLEKCWLGLQGNDENLQPRIGLLLFVG